MWVRKTTEELVEEPGRRQERDRALRRNPVLALILALVASLTDVTTFLRTDGRPMSWAECLGVFGFVFLFCYGVQVLFGVAAADSLTDPWGHPSASAPVAQEICPACQHLEPRPTAVAVAAVAPLPPRRCPECGAADLEALDRWRWREEDAGSEIAPLV